MNLFRYKDLVLSSNGPITANQRLVLMTIAKHANQKTGIAFPGQKLLEQETALSERSIRNALRGCERDGWTLTRTKMGRMTVHRHNEYELCVPRSSIELRESDAANRHEVSLGHEQAAKNAAPTGIKRPFDRHDVPHNSSENYSSTTKREKSARSLIDDWSLGEEEKRLCREMGVDAERTFKKFQAHHQSRGTQSINWSAEWKKWMCDERKPFAVSAEPPIHHVAAVRTRGASDALKRYVQRNPLVNDYRLLPDRPELRYPGAEADFNALLTERQVDV
jgi:hypothetical protein